MNLDDLLGDIEGIGGDYFVQSAPATRKQGTEQAAAPPAAPRPSTPPPAQMPEQRADHPVNEALSPPPSPMLSLVLDVEFEVSIELGTGSVPLKQLLGLQPGACFPLDRRPDEPLNVFVHGQRIARGEALIVDGALAIRITELLPNSEVALPG